MTKVSAKNKLIVLTAGGTGGHVYPADALATELEKRGYEVVLFTDRRGLNNYKGKLGEIENKAIYSGSVVGKSLLTKIMSLFKVCLGIVQAGYYLLKKRPYCVVGFGGYASFPTAIAAVVLRIPLIVHEQNSVMSRTNRILARFANLVAQSFRKVKNTPPNVKSVLTGMPVRDTITLLYNKEYKERQSSEIMPIIILGGSQGAKIFADIVPEAIKTLSLDKQELLEIYQQCRKDDIESLKVKYENIACKVVVSSFFENMPELYEKSKLIISRSGASSVYEIAAAGLPSILVPLPIAADNHQYYNAEELAESGAGLVLNQKDFTAEKLGEVLDDFLDNSQKLKKMSDNAKKMAIVDAAKRLADMVETVR